MHFIMNTVYIFSVHVEILFTIFKYLSRYAEIQYNNMWGLAEIQYDNMWGLAEIQYNNMWGLVFYSHVDNTLMTASFQ
jgi:hypothetical protein